MARGSATPAITGYLLRIVAGFGLTLVLTPTASLAQPSVRSASLSGFVYDAASGEALIGGSVSLRETGIGTITNLNGYYILPRVPAGTYTLVSTYIGYFDETQTITLGPNEDGHVDLNLRTRPEVMSEILIIADSLDAIDRLYEAPISRLELTASQLEQIPQVVEADLLRSLQTLPGIVSVSDYSSAPYIRGGTPDQNLYLIDGTDVYNPEHAFGLFSVFNPDALKKVEIYKGGFGAEYGGRLSSVLNITNLDGNKREFEGSAALSLLSARTTIQVPLAGRGSFSASVRRTYFDQTVARAVDDIPPYYFYDGNFKAFIDVNSTNKLSKRSVPHGGISGLRKNCSVLAFAGILESVGWSARFYGYWRRRESSFSIDLGQRLATHATGGAGAGGQLAGCHGASRAPRAGSGATGREDRVAGNGVGAPKRTGQWRRQGIVVGVGLSRLASLRQASIFGSVAGRSAGSRRPRSLVGVGGAGGRVGADQAEHVPPMRSGVVRRRSPSAASPGGRDPSGASPGHRVSVPYLALPALLHSDRSALAGGCVAPDLRAQCAGLGRFAVGRLPLEQAQHRRAAVRRLRRAPVSGHGQPAGTRGIGGDRRARRSRAGLRSPAADGQPRRDRLAGVSPPGLAVGGDHSWGLGIRHSPEPRSGGRR